MDRHESSRKTFCCELHFQPHWSSSFNSYVVFISPFSLAVPRYAHLKLVSIVTSGGGFEIVDSMFGMINIFTLIAPDFWLLSNFSAY